MLIALRHISLEYPQGLVLHDVSLVVNAGDKAGLVGPNGAGKTTLLRIAAGGLEPTSGVVERPPSVAIGYLPQEVVFRQDEFVSAYLRRVCGVESDADQLAALYASDLAEATNLERLGEVQERFERLGGFTFDDRAPDALRGAGLDTDLIGTAMSSLSGGQRARVALAAVMLDQHDLLLLDEPTNNLDIEGIGRLEEFIEESPRAYLCVSHDRSLLRKAMRQIVRLDKGSGSVTRYGLGYDEYLQALATESAAAQRHYAEYVEERGRLHRALDQSLRRGASAAGNKSASDNEKIGRHAAREKATGAHAQAGRRIAMRLQHLREPTRPVTADTLEFAFGYTPERVSDPVGLLEHAMVSYGSTTVGPLNLVVHPGERLAITGPNGSGKTTMVRALAGLQPIAAGRRSLAHGVRSAYLDQDLSSLRSRGTALANAMGLIATGALPAERRTKAASMLALFGIDPTDSRPVCNLSPGERMRVALASIAASQSNLLLLDEPTNHLDVPAAIELERALRAYLGTCVVITHDREFLRGIHATRRIELP